MTKNQKKLLVFSGLAFLLITQTPKVKTVMNEVISGLPNTRGFRNLNPFNIKKTTIKWAGKVAVSKDATFEQFVSMEMGIRAGMVNMRTQIGKGYNTIQKLIARHAPAMENPTSAFVKHVCNKAGVTASTVISASNKALFTKFCHAVVEFENGHALPLSTMSAVYDKYIK